MLHNIIPVLLSRLLSLLQASTLRERYYTLQNRVEILEVAIDDIERINSHSPHPNKLIDSICVNTKSKEESL